MEYAQVIMLFLVPANDANSGSIIWSESDKSE